MSKHGGTCLQGPVHAAVTIVREEGPLGLWAGATPTVLRNGTNQCVVVRLLDQLLHVDACWAKLPGLRCIVTRSTGTTLSGGR